MRLGTLSILILCLVMKIVFGVLDMWLWTSKVATGTLDTPYCFQIWGHIRVSLRFKSYSFLNIGFKEVSEKYFEYFVYRYLAPEYLTHGIVDEKTDVFSLGVLLLELVTGRRALDYSKQSLVLWVSLELYRVYALAIEPKQRCHHARIETPHLFLVPFLYCFLG